MRLLLAGGGEQREIAAHREGEAFAGIERAALAVERGVTAVIDAGEYEIPAGGEDGIATCFGPAALQGEVLSGNEGQIAVGSYYLLQPSAVRWSANPRFPLKTALEKQQCQMLTCHQS